jgi:Family of unknown function (DUF5985)
MMAFAHVLLGAVVMGDVMAALFFVRYWNRTSDRLFLFFAASFVADAVSRIVVDQGIPPFGLEALGYMIRILSYVLIIAGIVYKNRGSRMSRTMAQANPLPQQYIR